MSDYLKLKRKAFRKEREERAIKNGGKFVLRPRYRYSNGKRTRRIARWVRYLESTK